MKFNELNNISCALYLWIWIGRPDSSTKEPCKQYYTKLVAIHQGKDRQDSPLA